MPVSDLNRAPPTAPAMDERPAPSVDGTPAPSMDETPALLKDLIRLMTEMKAASGQPNLISLMTTHTNPSDKSLKEMTDILKEMNKREALSGTLEPLCPRSILNIHILM
jgi:hypothetical protein